MKHLLKILSIFSIIPIISITTISCVSKKADKESIEGLQQIFNQQQEAFGTFHTHQDVLQQIKFYAEKLNVKDYKDLVLSNPKLANTHLVEDSNSTNKNVVSFRLFSTPIEFRLKSVLKDEVKTIYSSLDPNEVIQIGYKKDLVKKGSNNIILNISNKKVKKVPIHLPLKINSFNESFKDLESKEIINLDKWDIKNVNSLFYAFKSAKQFNQDLSSWNTINVTNMQGVFYDAINFNKPLNSWKIDNVTNLEEMFVGAEKFNQDLNSWNTSKVTDISKMFWEATAFNGDISKWNVSNVKDMVQTFAGAEKFNQDISRWDTSKVESMYGMFSSATNFDRNLKNWNVQRVFNAQDFQKNATHLTADKIPNFKVPTTYTGPPSANVPKTK
ncbi:BspA family leucine-rich repeat surface protein [Mycoplasma feriruminatoris]|uniref:Prolipoprotein n=1 Tax=Mycoplasma feriruminatoris TaxID=1179777 RepID=A0A654IG85_9MOLU|nr:BspA family leucine-rich repeat surface protein [Mycoplasma feriruminatoris]WFQ93247.1 prolipoprotein [Mycoplasma feriruminatoris]WFQ94084.1 hypothetical protein MFERI15220_00135 [Mycoplasma feriruminatoris]VZR97096.1 hypothetical protein MF5295_00139 [Mycoplasma feriruminatoris]VZR99549.1 hypothetical protein MF5583_00136 [Mycoplasma feriruminatoris]